MNLTLRLSPPVRLWHHELRDRLVELGHNVSVTVTVGTESPSTESVERLAWLECRLHGVQRRRTRRVSREVFVGVSARPDLTIDLGSAPTPGERTLRLEFDGLPGEAAMLDALLSGRAPLVRLVDGASTEVASMRPGTEFPGVMISAWEDLLVRCTTLILDGISHRPYAAPFVDEDDQDHQLAERPPSPSPSALRRAARELAGSGVHRIYRTLYRAPHWRIGWRFVDGPGLLDQPEHPPSDWQVLVDDGKRFYADPFPFTHGDETLLFVEDFEHRKGQGVISVVRFDDHGPVGSPSPVLHHDVHLSYPFVFEHDGAIWMIPETCGAGTVELYRAARFPDRWQRETTLITGAEVSDATVMRHQGLWWMLGTVRDEGSFSDALHCWYAEELTGPWRPHDHNPVLVDIASARPAGRVAVSNGRLLRPAQDCRAGYGAALTIAEVTALSADAFDQRVIAALRPGAWWPGRRLHTLNRAGRLECIDGSALAPRFPVPAVLRRTRLGSATT